MYLHELGPSTKRQHPLATYTPKSSATSPAPPHTDKQKWHFLPKCCSGKAMWTVLDFLWLFMETSSIHGFNHLTTSKRTFWEYVLWFVCLCMGVWGAISVGLSTWNRYQENPTVISMERDFHEWNTTFPGVTICPTKQYSNDSLWDFVDGLQNSGDEDEMIIFLRKLAEATYLKFEDMPDPPTNNTVQPKNYQKTIYSNRFAFNYTVVNSVQGEQPEIVRHLSEMGVCYTYNTQMAIYNAPEIWDGSMEIILPLVVISGNSLDGDLFSQIMDMNSPSNIYFHGPEDVPDIATQKMNLSDNIYKTVDLSGFSLYTTEEAKKLTVYQRKCRFPEESNLQISTVYSYNICRMECRMMLALKLCGCVPLFYHNVNECICMSLDHQPKDNIL